MSYTFEQLKDDVRKEAEALKIHATKEELSKLNLDQLRPTLNSGCIYGLMTSHCNSDRAIQLIESCACRFIKDNSISSIQYEGFDRVQKVINGEKVENLQESRKDLFEPGHYSAIEAYILLPEAKNANLIAFLRVETDNLEL